MNRMLVTVFLTLIAGLIASPLRADDCLGCHQGKTPAAVKQWRESAHGRAGVGCRDCHGSDHALMVKGEARVSAKQCGACHAKAYGEHTASRHGMGLHSGWGCTRSLKGRDQRECSFCHEPGSSLPRSDIHCARFLKQSSEMGEIGCNRCHQVENSCASCHSSHATDLRIVRDPAVCATCHMGPDHPQWEMWQTSRHGVLNASMGSSFAPNCQNCHMGQGNHNVSRGLTVSSGSIPFGAEAAAKGRSEMLAVCGGCHAVAMAARELSRGDTVRDQGLKLVKEAEGIIAGLNDEGLLDPMPDKRPPHPFAGSQLVLDNQMLYEDTSHIERLFFKMKKYDLAKTVKGAYHQNPAYTHWYGNAELKMDLVDIKAEAGRLRGRKANAVGSARPDERRQIEEQLELLKKKGARGAITAEELERERRRLLERFLELR